MWFMGCTSWRRKGTRILSQHKWGFRRALALSYSVNCFSAFFLFLCFLFVFFSLFFLLSGTLSSTYICVRLYTPGSLCFVLICCSVCWDVMLFIWQTLLFFRGCFWVICHFAYIIFLITVVLFCNSSHISSIWIPLWFRVKGCGKLPLAYVTKSMEYLNTFSLRQFATNQQLSHAKPTATL